MSTRTHFDLNTTRRCFKLIAFVALLGALPTTPASAQKAGDVKKITIPGTKTVIEMVYIPGGTFLMGSPDDEEDRNADEGPQVAVTIEPFWMSKYEMTWAQYQPFLDLYGDLKTQGGNIIPKDKQADAVSIPTPVYGQDAVPIYQAMGWRGTYPVSDMTQLSAKQYTKWLSKKLGQFVRLPTEAEWEYAARAGTTTPYYFGDDSFDLEEHAYFRENSKWNDITRGHPDPDADNRGYRKVGSLKGSANAWGLYDMHGNVAEWVIDQYDPNHYAKLASKAGGKPISWKDAVNWPTSEYSRVVRGGHWESNPEACRSASRLGSTGAWKRRDPQFPKSIWWHTHGFMVGFRVIIPVDQNVDLTTKKRFWDADFEGARDVIENSDKQLRTLIGPTK